MINAELLKDIDKEFESLLQRNTRIKALYQKAKKGKATFEDAGNLAVEMGKELSKAFGMNISPTILPDGKMTFSIANEVVKPELIKGYDYTASFFNTVQNAYFKSKKLNITSPPPDMNESRIDGFVEKLTSDDYENVSWILENEGYIQNYLESVVDTGLKIGAALLAQSGIRSTVTREIDSGACPWCIALAGEYEYGDIPDGVYRRHRDCHCRISYKIPDNFRQSQWTQKTWGTDAAELEARRRFEYTKQQLSPEKARALEEAILNN